MTKEQIDFSAMAIAGIGLIISTLYSWWRSHGLNLQIENLKKLHDVEIENLKHSLQQTRDRDNALLAQVPEFYKSTEEERAKYEQFRLDRIRYSFDRAYILLELAIRADCEAQSSEKTKIETFDEIKRQTSILLNSINWSSTGGPVLRDRYLRELAAISNSDSSDRFGKMIEHGLKIADRTIALIGAESMHVSNVQSKQLDAL
ncbi:MAG: hypothetical protein KF824_12645 [Fimbriimonadaceae bacterium]|nr:MAG: hypothetical protein KF824_12645 [Fimbriimonadaceae bacterium]